MKNCKILILAFFFIFFNFQNLQSKENKILVDRISKNLRCLICQGQSVYDSQSEFSLSMKILIDKKLKEGKSEKEIYEFFKAKYGNWIVYEPEFSIYTFFLWGIPLILFIFGGFLILKKAFINS